MHDVLKGKVKNLEIVLYIPRGIANDQDIKNYFEVKQIDENFTIIRSRDELDFMLGCLYTNSNKIVYASEYRHSFPQDLVKLLNPDSKGKNNALKHINLKEFLMCKDRTDLLKLLHRIIPENIDLKREAFTSEPIGCKYKNKEMI